MQSFKLKFIGVTILQGVKFPIFLLIFEWALQQCGATALPVIITRFPMSPRWTSYVAPKSPRGGSKTQCPKFEQSCDNSETVRDLSQLLLITSRKSHTGFRLSPTLMTLNGLERRNCLISRFFTEFDSIAGRLCHSCWMSVKYCLSVPVVNFSPKLMHPAARSLCDSWASCHITFAKMAASWLRPCQCGPGAVLIAKCGPFTDL